MVTSQAMTSQIAAVHTLQRTLLLTLLIVAGAGSYFFSGFLLNSMKLRTAVLKRICKG